MGEVITSVLPVLQACMYLYNEMRSIFKHSLGKLKSLFQFISVLNTNYVLGNSYFLFLIMFEEGSYIYNLKQTNNCYNKVIESWGS